MLQEGRAVFLKCRPRAAVQCLWSKDSFAHDYSIFSISKYLFPVPVTGKTHSLKLFHLYADKNLKVTLSYFNNPQPCFHGNSSHYLERKGTEFSEIIFTMIKINLDLKNKILIQIAKRWKQHKYTPRDEWINKI